MIEVCHGIERYPNPRPERNTGGDCFACALYAGLRLLYPRHRKAVTFDTVYDLFYTARNSADEPVLNNTWLGFKKALQGASDKWGRLQIEYDMPRPVFREPHWRGDDGHYGWAFAVDSDRYVQRLEGWLRGGWVAWTVVDADGLGPTVHRDDEVYFNSIDHFVVLDGVRSVYEATYDDGGSFRSGTWNDYVHVVCSSRTKNLTGWHTARTFLLKHGACSWWLARHDVR